MVKMKFLGNLYDTNGSSESNDTSRRQNFQHKKNRPSEGETFDFLSLIQSWDVIVGEGMAKKTSPQKLVRGQLTILSAHSAFSHQLSVMENIIIEKIEKSFPVLKKKITKIIFITNPQFFIGNQGIQGQLQAKKEKEIKTKIALHPLSPEYKKLRKEALEEFQDLEDGELKEKMISIFIQSKQV